MNKGRSYIWGGGTMRRVGPVAIISKGPKEGITVMLVTPKGFGWAWVTQYCQACEIFLLLERATPFSTLLEKWSSAAFLSQLLCVQIRRRRYLHLHVTSNGWCTNHKRLVTSLMEIYQRLAATFGTWHPSFDFFHGRSKRNTCFVISHHWRCFWTQCGESELIMLC